MAVVIRVRREQVCAVEEPLEASFRTRAREHLERCFADSLQTLDSEQRSDLVARGLGRGRAWGLRSERALLSFLALEVVLGEGFVDHPQYRWTRGYLDDPAVDDPDERMRRLRVEALRRLRVAQRNRILEEEFTVARHR